MTKNVRFAGNSEPRQLEQDAAQLIGLIVFEFGYLEVNLSMSLRMSISPQNPMGADAVIDRLRFKQKLDSLRDHVERHHSEHSLLADDARDVFNRLESWRAKRNRFLHGRWSVNLHEIVLVSPGIPSDKPAKTTQYTIESLKSELDDLQRAVQSFHRFRDKWSEIGL